MKGITHTPAPVGYVLNTPPGSLPCNKAFHIVYKESAHSSGYANQLDAAFGECIKLANITTSTSIAFSLFTIQKAFEFSTVVETAVRAVMDNAVKKSQGNLTRFLFVTNSTALVKKASNELHHAVSCKYG